MTEHPVIEPILDDTAADLIGECDICGGPHVYAYVAGQFVCASEACAAAALAEAAPPEPMPRPRPVRSDPDTFDPMTAPAGYRPLFDRRPCGRLGPGTCCRDRALWDPELEEEG